MGDSYAQRVGEPLAVIGAAESGGKYDHQGATMDIYIASFAGGIGFLDPIFEDPRFDAKDWSSMEPLIGEFRAALMTWDAQYPGWHEAFKLAYRVVLNHPTYDIGDRLGRIMDFGLPEPFYEFLVYMWTLLYPGEPWKDTVDLQAVRIHWEL